MLLSKTFVFMGISAVFLSFYLKPETPEALTVRTVTILISLSVAVLISLAFNACDWDFGHQSLLSVNLIANEAAGSLSNRAIRELAFGLILILAGVIWENWFGGTAPIPNPIHSQSDFLTSLRNLFKGTFAGYIIWLGVWYILAGIQQNIPLAHSVVGTTATALALISGVNVLNQAWVSQYAVYPIIGLAAVYHLFRVICSPQAIFLFYPFSKPARHTLGSATYKASESMFYLIVAVTVYLPSWLLVRLLSDYNRNIPRWLAALFGL